MGSLMLLERHYSGIPLCVSSSFQSLKPQYFKPTSTFLYLKSYLWQVSLGGDVQSLWLRPLKWELRWILQCKSLKISMERGGKNSSLTWYSCFLGQAVSAFFLEECSCWNNGIIHRPCTTKLLSRTVNPRILYYSGMVLKYASKWTWWEDSINITDHLLQSSFRVLQKECWLYPSKY